MGRPSKQTESTEFTNDPIPVETEVFAKEQGMNERESILVEVNQTLTAKLSEMEQRFRRLEAVADQNKVKAYNDAQRDLNEKHIFLRFLDDPKDPIVEFGSVENMSFVDPGTGQLIERIRYWVKTLSGVRKEMTIQEWNRIGHQQVWAKIKEINHNTDIATIALSDDGGKTFLGTEITLNMKFVNPG